MFWVTINFYLLIFLLTGFVQSNYSQRLNDNMCPTTRETLCIRDVLINITTIAKIVSRTANQIEKHILRNVGDMKRFKDKVNYELEFTHSHVPILEYHFGFFQRNNIDRHYLIRLILEAHYALSFYFNSINDTLNMLNVFSSEINTWFKEIQVNLKYDMICPYRSVLNVYSHPFPLITEIKRIRFSEEGHTNTPSLVHHVHSIVVAGLLRQWMQSIKSVINELESKFI